MNTSYTLTGYYELPLERRLAIEASAKRIYRAFAGDSTAIFAFVRYVKRSYHFTVTYNTSIAFCLDMLLDLVYNED